MFDKKKFDRDVKIEKVRLIRYILKAVKRELINPRDVHKNCYLAKRNYTFVSVYLGDYLFSNLDTMSYFYKQRMLNIYKVALRYIRRKEKYLGAYEKVEIAETESCYCNWTSLDLKVYIKKEI